MKFMAFVPCCGSAAATSRPEVTPERPSETEETRSLVPTPPIRTRRKRGRRGGSPQGSAAEWKPSLCSISEDHDAFEKSGQGGDRTAAGAERLVKRKSSVRSPKKSFVSYNDNYGRSSFHSVIPALAPTPFMF